jgi:hypothetical protein
MIGNLSTCGLELRFNALATEAETPFLQSGGEWWHCEEIFRSRGDCQINIECERALRKDDWILRSEVLIKTQGINGLRHCSFTVCSQVQRLSGGGEAENLLARTTALCHGGAN